MLKVHCHLTKTEPATLTTINRDFPIERLKTQHFCPHPLKGTTHLVTVVRMFPFATPPKSVLEKDWKGLEVDFINDVANKIGFEVNFKGSYLAQIVRGKRSVRLLIKRLNPLIHIQRYQTAQPSLEHLEFYSRESAKW